MIPFEELKPNYIYENIQPYHKGVQVARYVTGEITPSIYKVTLYKGMFYEPECIYEVWIDDTEGIENLILPPNAIGFIKNGEPLEDYGHFVTLVKFATFEDAYNYIKEEERNGSYK